MPQRRLDHEDVAGPLIQPERERVPQAVRRVPAADPGAAQPELEPALGLAWGKPKPLGCGATTFGMRSSLTGLRSTSPVSTKTSTKSQCTAHTSVDNVEPAAAMVSTQSEARLERTPHRRSDVGDSTASSRSPTAVRRGGAFLIADTPLKH